MKRKTKYSDELPRKMYEFFLRFDSSSEAPSFVKFARSVGLTTEEIASFLGRKEFARAYRECSEIRRDYLIDRALSRRYDPSFVKFLLTEEADSEESEPSVFRLEVSE